jgi:hypothetical protein
MEELLEKIGNEYISNKNLEIKEKGGKFYNFKIKNFSKYKNGFYFYIWYNNIYSYRFLKINNDKDLFNYIDELNEKLYLEKIWDYPYGTERQSKFCKICDL